MITRLEVDGFKSLRNFAVDLEPFTVLVGPNDAGKSNILEALALAAALGRETPEAALMRGRGSALDKFSRHGATTAPAISLALECLVHPNPHHFLLRERYELVLERGFRNPRAERVELKTRSSALRDADDAWLKSHPEWAQHVHRRDDTPRAGTFSPGVYLVQINAAQLRESSDRIDSRKLAPDASNLPSVLAGLSDQQLGQIRAAFIGLIPGVSDFEIVPHDDNLEVVFRTREDELVPARLASDGTLRTLGLLTAVLARPDDGSPINLVCIEEPENGIYPGRLSRLVEVLKDATDASAWPPGEGSDPPLQIILTTHSPIVLAAMEHHRDTLRFVDVIRRDGVRYTRARRVVEGAVNDRMMEASTREIEARLNIAMDSEDR